jgi:hypothetical protein
MASYAIGIKGSDVYASTTNKVLDLSVMLNRGLAETEIRSAIDAIVAAGDKTQLEDAFVLLFQTRDVRGGKGERDLFQHLWASLSTHRADLAASVLDLVPEYGCWQDLLQLATGPFQSKVYNLMLNQLKRDEKRLADHEATLATLAVKDAEFPPLSGGTSVKPARPKLSLVAKWLPREHSNNAADKAHASALASYLSPTSRAPQAEYRKRVAAVNKALGTVEITLCGGEWAGIEPSKVPGRALKQYRGAFLNQPVKGAHGRKVASTNPDRVACAEHFTAHFSKAARGEAKVNGSDTVFPHELVKQVLEHGGTYDHYYGDTGPALEQADRDAIESQWRAIWDKVRAAGSLGRTLAMSDFSGSMAGDPMNVSMALGLGIAECNTGVFKDHLLTFDSTPTLHKFTATNFVDRVNEVRHLAQGTSTDFQAAYNLVLAHLKTHGVPPGQEPTDLIVLTDMGFDAATRGGDYGLYTGSRHTEAVKTQETETHAQIARRAFKLAGEALFGEGKGWQAPRIVIWNLRAAYKDFQAAALETGVVQVAGWSPSLLRVLMTHGADAMTPEAMLRAQLDDPRYDPVRSRIHPLLNPVESSYSYFGC